MLRPIHLVLVLAVASPTALAAIQETAEEEPPRGLIKNEAGAFQGYTLFHPMRTNWVFLLDMQGRVVHIWEGEFAGGANYLLDNGNLLFSTSQPDAPLFEGGGAGGRIQEYTWDGELVWDLIYANEQHRQHHDIEPLPNGNILMIAWEHKTAREALDAGRHPPTVDEEKGLWPEKVVEIRKVLPDAAEVVWEWHLWDHLIQEVDEALPHHGSVFEHPERVDINGERARPMSEDEREELVALGYLTAEGARSTDRERKTNDWCHINAIDYNAELDQIALSVPRFHEIWIIDHSTTTAEAAGHSGGRSGKGGDLLYRYGNPQTYRRGSLMDQRLWFQHDVRWIPAGYPGEGNLTVFNNGRGRPEAEGGEHSSVDEIEVPLDDDGVYWIDDGLPFEPSEPVWSYAKPSEPDRFYSSYISGAHRLPNGNTMICSGASGRLFEVTADGDIVWEYRNPYFKPQEEERRGRGSRYGVFRATRIAADHPALKGRELQPIDPQPPFEFVAAAEEN